MSVPPHAVRTYIISRDTVINMFYPTWSVLTEDRTMTVLDVIFHILLIRQLISSWCFPTKKNPFWIQSCFLQKVVCKISSQPILLQSKAIVPKAIYSFHHFFHKLFPYSRTANIVKLKVNFHTASYYFKTYLFSQRQCMVFVIVFSIQELNV